MHWIILSGVVLVLVLFLAATFLTGGFSHLDDESYSRPKRR